LSNAAFDARYAPSRTQVAAVQGWLRAQGFLVTKTLPSGTYVEASGTVTQLERAFGAEINRYSYRGKTVRSTPPLFRCLPAPPWWFAVQSQACWGSTRGRS
jgi:subtilase family serine protease